MSVRKLTRSTERKSLIKHGTFLRVAHQSEETGEPSTPWQKNPQFLSHRSYGVQKCDAKQPCTTCIQLDGGLGCVYERRRAAQRVPDKISTDIQPFLSSFECETNPCDSSPPAPDIFSPEASSLVTSSTCPTLSSASPGKSHRSDSDPPDRYTAPQKKSSPETQLAPSRKGPPKPHRPDIIPTFSFLPSLHLPSVPRLLDVSFPLMNPECFQISDTTPSESDLP